MHRVSAQGVDKCMINVHYYLMLIFKQQHAHKQILPSEQINSDLHGTQESTLLHLTTENIYK